VCISYIVSEIFIGRKSALGCLPTLVSFEVVSREVPWNKVRKVGLKKPGVPGLPYGENCVIL